MASYTVVGASASPLFTGRPNLIRSAILRSVINGWEKVPTILDAIVNGYNVDFRRAYDFGLNGYYRGIWQANNEDELIDWNEVKQWLANQLGVSASSISFISTNYDQPSDSIYELASIANVINGRVDLTTGYYTDMFNLPAGLVAEVTNTEYERTNPDDDPQAPPEYDLVVTYDRFDPSDKAGTLEPDLVWGMSSNYLDLNQPLNDHIMLRFKVNSGPDLYFTYDPQSWTYPELSEQIFGDVQSNYYPIAMVRKRNEWIGEDSHNTAAENEEELEDTRRLMDYYGVNLDDIIESLDTNPDIADIDNAYVAPALVISDLLDLDEVLLEYLFTFGEYLIDNYNPKTKEEWEDTGNVYTGNTQYIWFYEQIASTFRVQLSWGYIDKVSIPYVTGKSGYEFGKEINYTQEYNATWEEEDGEVSYIYVDHYDKATSTATRLRIGNLENYLVYNVSNPDQTPRFTLRNAFPQAGEDTLSGIVIPMNHEVVSSMSKSKATAVMLSSLVLVTQSYEQIKLKWYERQDFWDAIKIIIFVVSVIYMSPQLSAAAQQGVSEVVAYILESIVIGAVVSEAVGYVTTFLAEQLGGDVALVLAVIAAAVSAYYGYTGQTFAYLPTAADMLKVVTIMVESINEVTAEEYKELQEEYSEFLTEYNEALEILEEAQDGLLDVGIDPAWIARNTGLLPNETPDMFYHRTVGMPNPGIYSIDAVTNFYEDQLTLPSTASSGLTL